jgi:lipopolysaccharide/colanic/teichoic acid biosynthesis glycosyltransferase
MIDDAEKDCIQWSGKDDPRVTRLGVYLRRYHIDELPQLWNIFIGDMSFVGPRPQLVRDMVFMSEEQRLRHSVRPGLTGLAQVSGRSSLPWKKRFELDTEYAKNVSFFLDAKIIFLTAVALFGKGNDGDVENFYDR